MSNKKRLVLRIDDDDMGRIEDIKREMGFKSRTKAIMFSVNTTFKKKRARKSL